MDHPPPQLPFSPFGFPRMRGDGPVVEPPPPPPPPFPPHARGWTVGIFLEAPAVDVSPACAGMDLPRSSWISEVECFPRMRGDGPGSIAETYTVDEFPRMRGDGPIA